MEFNKKKFSQLIKEQLKEGKTKNEIYNELKTEAKDVKNQKKIADLVRFSVEDWRMKKYGIYNTLFLIFLIVIELLNILTLNYGGIIWYGFFTYIVAKKFTKHYHWFTFVGIISMFLGVLPVLINIENTNIAFLILTIVFSVVIGLIFVLFGVKMPPALTPKYRIIEEIITDSDGKKENLRDLNTINNT